MSEYDCNLEHCTERHDIDGWRFYYLVDGTHLASPFRPADDEMPDADLQAVCQTYDHTAPDLNCSCGIWTAHAPASLLTVALHCRDWTALPAIILAATRAEERGEEYRIPTPVLAKVRAYDTLPVTNADVLKKSRVVWSLVGKKQGPLRHWSPELGIFRRAARVEVTELHVGAHDFSGDEYAAIEGRYGVTMTEHRVKAHTSKFGYRIGGVTRAITSPARAKSEYEIVRSFVPSGDAVEAKMRSFGLLPGRI